MLPSPSKTVLIVDDDLGFVFWLGEIFTGLGWNAVPALNCRRAISLADMLDLNTDLIVVNPALRGVPELLRKLSRVRRPKVVVIGGGDVEKKRRFHPDATLDRPEVASGISRTEWTKRIQQMLREIGAA